MNRISIYLLALLMSLTSVALTGCSDENEVEQTQYGYVQFKVGQAVTRSSVDRLDNITDAKKVKVLLQYNGYTIEQTLLLNAYNNLEKEFIESVSIEIKEQSEETYIFLKGNKNYQKARNRPLRLEGGGCLSHIPEVA